MSVLGVTVLKMRDLSYRFHIEDPNTFSKASMR